MPGAELAWSVFAASFVYSKVGDPESGIDLRPIGRAGAGRSYSEQGFRCQGVGERPPWAEMSQGSEGFI